MGVVNQPPNIYTMFQDIQNRLTKLENATRFTMPNVSSDPTVYRNGDLWLNTTSNSPKYVDSSGNVTTLGGGGGGGGIIPNYRVFPAGNYFNVKTTTGTSSTIGIMTAVPFWVSATTTFTKIGCFVTSGGVSSAFRLGIWNNDATTDRPSTLFADYGTVATTSGGFKEITGQTITLTAGLWWIGGANTGSPGATMAATALGFPLYPLPFTSAPTSNTQYNAYSATYTSGTLPTFVGSTTLANNGFSVWLGL